MSATRLMPQLRMRRSTWSGRSTSLRRPGKWTLASSGGALYRRNAPIPSGEIVPPLPESPHGIAKYCAEQYIELFNRLHRTRHTILRLANVYVPRQDPSGDAGVFPIFCGCALKGKIPPSMGCARPGGLLISLGLHPWWLRVVCRYGSPDCTRQPAILLAWRAFRNLPVYLGGGSCLLRPGVPGCPIDTGRATHLPFLVAQDGLQGGSQSAR